MTRTDLPGTVLSWPWREDCECQLLSDGSVFLPRMLDALRQAREKIDVELYICESGRVFNEWFEVLAEKAESLPVRLVIDEVGSEGLSRQDRSRLADSAISLRWFNRTYLTGGYQSLVRDHRKLVIVDGKTAWVGGMALSDDLDPRVKKDLAWLDAMVEMRGPVVDDWGALFEQAWEQANKPLHKVRRWRQTRKAAGGGPHHEATGMAKVTASRGGLRNPLLFSLLRRIALAQHNVWLNTPYFFPPRRLVKALCRAARRGVKVHVGVPGPITDHPSFRFAGQHYYSRMLRAGVRIHEFQPRFAHLKAAIVDNWCTLGSCNYDRWDNYWNLDANVEVIDPRFRQELEALRHDLEQQSILIDAERWEHRSCLDRTRQAFWFWFGVRVMHFLRSPEKE